jgi:hypothetical protein
MYNQSPCCSSKRLNFQVLFTIQTQRFYTYVNLHVLNHHYGSPFWKHPFKITIWHSDGFYSQNIFSFLNKNTIRHKVNNFEEKWSTKCIAILGVSFTVFCRLFEYGEFYLFLRLNILENYWTDYLKKYKKNRNRINWR